MTDHDGPLYTLEIPCTTALPKRGLSVSRAGDGSASGQIGGLTAAECPVKHAGYRRRTLWAFCPWCGVNLRAL